MSQVQHILTPEQFSREELEGIFEESAKMKRKLGMLKRERRLADVLKGYHIKLLALEPSTRTMDSFDHAATRLGARVSRSDNAKLSSSLSKGEPLEDMIRVLAGKYDAIVLRHDTLGAAERAAKVAGPLGVSIANAGDGPGQHPSQMILDHFTMLEKLGRLEGLTVGVVGDLKHGRVFRSDVVGFAKFGMKVLCVAPEGLEMQQDTRDFCNAQEGFDFEETTELDPHLGDLDVLMMLRLQYERFKKEELEHFKGVYQRIHLSTKKVAKMKPDSIIMHPLPRGPELPFEIDSDSRAVYFEQSDNGDPTRMVLLRRMLRSEMEML